MSIASGLRRRVTRASIQQASCMPFLYETSTILRGSACTERHPGVTRSQQATYSTGLDALLDASGSKQNHKASSEGRRARQTPGHNGRPQQNIRRSAPRRNARIVESSPSWSEDQGSAPLLPFMEPERGFGRGRVSKNSSLTGSEARAFQALLTLQQKPWVGVDPPKDPNEPDLVATVGKAVGVDIPYDSSAQLALEYAAGNTPGSESTQIESPEQAQASAVIRKVRALMKDAQTDLRMWEILHEQAIDPVKTLGLDGSDDTPSVSKALLSLTFPKLLITFHQVLRSSFPTSMYGLALLPYLQQLGPATFVFGATTELYNHHLRLLYEQRMDVRGMINVIGEMHKKVFDFDADTRAIVQVVLDQATNARERPKSPAHRLFWETRIMEQNVKRLTEWASIIETSMAETVLQRTRNERLSKPSADYIQKYGTAAVA